LATIPEHGVPPAVTFEIGGDAAWVVAPTGTSARRIGMDGTIGDRVHMLRNSRVGSVVAVRTADTVAITALDVANGSLLTLTVRDGASPSDPIVRDIPSARPLGSLDVDALGAIQILDAAQRPLGDGLHPAMRGLAIPGGRRVRAGVSSAGPMLFITGPNGKPTRVLMGSIPKAERVQALGVDERGRPWLVAETGPADDRTRHLVWVDLQGRVLERAKPPRMDDSTGPAGPGKGSGRVAAAVDAAGRVLWAGATERGIEVHLYTPGVPGRGRTRIQVRPDAPKTED
jgi:hypothetical protein